MARLDPFRSADTRAEFDSKYDAILRTWPVPYESRRVTTAFGTTHVVVSGAESAPPLILLHGATATAMMWQPVIAALSESHRCFCVDTITEPSRSQPTQLCRGVPRLVDWLRELLVGLDVGSAQVVGMSYGGWLATNLAIHAPGVVERLVLLCPAATLAPLTPEFYVRMLSCGLLRSPELGRRFMRWMSVTPDIATDPTADLIITSLVSCRLLRANATPPTVLPDAALRSIVAPTTVLIGDREVIYRRGPHDALARAQRLIPTVRTQLIPDASHMVTRDNVEGLTAALTAALY